MKSRSENGWGWLLIGLGILGVGLTGWGAPGAVAVADGAVSGAVPAATATAAATAPSADEGQAAPAGSASRVPVASSSSAASLAVSTSHASNGAAPNESGSIRHIGFFVSDVDGFIVREALRRVADLRPRVEVSILGASSRDRPETRDLLRRLDVAIVDIMPPQPGQWILENRRAFREDVRFYAVRTSNHNEDYRNAGFLWDETVRAYFGYTTAENLANLIRFVAARDFRLPVEPAASAPVVSPENALYHPDAPQLFTDLDAYVKWYRESNRLHPDGLWNVSVIFPTFAIDGKRGPLDALIRAYETQGINTVCWFREMKDRDRNLEALLSKPPLASRLGSITGFDFRFSSTLTEGAKAILEKADVPIINTQYLFFGTEPEWMASEQGMSAPDIPLQFSTPELSGLIEPAVIGVKRSLPATEGGMADAAEYVAVGQNVERLAARVAKWHALRQKPNAQKKIVLMYYNHGAGKQNIGASYLNVFRSIEAILGRLRKEGYTVSGELREAAVQQMLIQSGRNIGSWAPDELKRLLMQGRVVRISQEQYRTWYEKLPAAFREAVEKDWGSPRDSRIMTHEGDFIIPCIPLGNVVLVPQPVRGWSDDPDKLYHSTLLFPHHQYVAFYLWMQHVFRPDALISLGTHGTHEWLPGKQAGLSWQCSPEVLIDDIPNVYPYIVDDVGEGIQAKRRGRGVVIDHAVPALKPGGLYGEYSELSAWIDEYEAAASDAIRESRLERIRSLASRMGLDRDLGLAEVGAADIETLAHELLRLKTEVVPYGLHTFGVSAQGEALSDTASAIAEKGGRDKGFYEEKLARCGPSEMDSLVRGLGGGYVGAGPGNDPIRNPDSLPTGKNFYAFDPEKIPSKEAWENGRKAANDLIAAWRSSHEGAFPEQIGVILWSVETIRDEGIQVATALALMGMRPVWDRRDKVRDIAPITGAELGRPRIDVLLQMSGLFRDTFPGVALLLDRAVRQAAELGDVENFIAKHTRAIEAELVKEGFSPERARALSRVRLYSAAPGAYGTKVEDLTGASGMWEKDDTVAENGFVRMQSFGYSADTWGEALTPVYRKHLKRVDATVHSLSSNLYGTMDNDDMFQYLGGLSMAVRKASGKAPDVFVSNQRVRGQGRMEPIAETLGREARSRYWNPRWMEGMKREGYAGAREMAHFVEYLWGWQVTTPEAVDGSRWKETFEVYVEDKHHLDVQAFLEKANPWAYQSMTARMLEAVRKGYWEADEAVRQKLAAAYALNVVQAGVACCDHTCNNPLLNQMVVQILSIPGVISPQVAEQFRMAVEKVAGKPLEEQVQERRRMLGRLEAVPAPNDAAASAATEAPQTTSPQEAPKAEATAEGGADAPENVTGYRMETIRNPDPQTRLSTSGIQWMAAVFVLVLIGVFLAGSRLAQQGRRGS
ncbi:cobaltochelatase subunit CobN [Desulfatirhabdium butyrativorans]|uniref:cobaltochelatase subunit CobN n=1 Tax=Desulfatirhabdium butyrativorans TaxID=340467 RepID=UPI000685189C|nr:cobaltochelatase subunit CobN [Desulfatirhabdium butyrativorans]